MIAARRPFALVALVLAALALLAAPIVTADMTAHAEMMATAMPADSGDGDCEHDRGDGDPPTMEDCLAACIAAQHALAALPTPFGATGWERAPGVGVVPRLPPAGFGPGLDPPPPRAA